MSNKQEGFRRFVVLLRILGALSIVAWALHIGYSLVTGTMRSVPDGGIAVLFFGGVMFGLAYILRGFIKPE